jgi:hypothetical protein
MEQRSALRSSWREREPGGTREPEHLADEVAAGAMPIDIRPFGQRQRDGELPGAIIIDRKVLEWRLDPTGGT